MYPSVALYLERLPRGIDSFPAAEVKGALVRAVLERAQLAGTLDPTLVPPCVARLMHEPPTVNSWLPEVHYGVLLTAVFEVRFRSVGQAAFDKWLLEGNRKTVASPIYRAIFLVTSRERIWFGVAKRWAHFHRGTTLSAVKYTEQGAHVRLTHPPRLFADAMTSAIASAYHAVAEMIGGKDVRVQREVESEIATSYHIAWT
jgi:hypothetical protein